MRITVDDRERNSGVIEHLQAIQDVEVDVDRLLLGDYLVDHRLVFERKTIHDFAVSLIDGRLFKQGCRLASSPIRPVLILEGSPSDWAAVGVSREAILGAMVTITVILGIPLLTSLEPAETARLIAYTGEQIDRSAEGAVQRSGYRPKGKRKRQLYILQSLPGVGPKRANHLLERFGTVEAVMKADADTLSQRGGLGRKTVAAIRQAVSESRVLYASSPAA